MRAPSRSRVTIAAPLIAAAAVLAGCGNGSVSCGQCGRTESRNLAFTMNLADGGAVRTCCPRCALRYLAGERPPVERLEVRDFETAEALDARIAVYVEGSDVHPCALGREGPPRDERGCCLAPVYDRCLPSVVAFADRAAAERFTRAHGGFVTTFAALEDAARPH